MDVVTSLPHRGMSFITGRLQVLEVLRDALSARNAHLQLDGSSRTLRIDLGSMRLGATRSLSGAMALECRAQGGDFVNENWTVGGGANLWFADATGIYSFRVKIVGGTRTSLIVNQPACIVCFCRRVAQPSTDGVWSTGAWPMDSGVREPEEMCP